MCTSIDTSVTTTSSVTVRPSTMVPMVKSIPPFDHQVRSETTATAAAAVLPASASVKAVSADADSPSDDPALVSMG